MRRMTAVILAAVLTCMTLTGCGRYELNGQGCESYDITVQGAIFGGAGDDAIRTQVTFDPRWVTKEDNRTYNKELAAFAAILSTDVYYRTKDLDRGTPNRVLYEGENEEAYDWTNFLKRVGFTEVEYIESFRAKSYAGDGNDSATLLLAHGTVDPGYDLYAVALRGCFSAQEWISMYDPGCEGEAYTALTGSHPEWTDAGTCKGLDIAKNRAMEFIEDFMDRTDDPDRENCMLITGHSRGGALANMIGGEMENREDVRSYTYTFNAPGVTTDEAAGGYQTVFNIFDSNDYYTDPIPFGEEHFYRYGRDLTAAIADRPEVKAAVAELKGRDDYQSMTAEAKAEYAERFGKRFPDRASLYEMTTVTQSFDTEEEALARAEACLSLIGSEAGLGLEGLCRLEGYDLSGQGAEAAAEPGQAVAAAADGRYQVSMTYCDAAILISYAKTLAYGTSAYEAVCQLFEEDQEACEILHVLMDQAAGLTGGHLLANGYVLTQYVQ